MTIIIYIIIVYNNRIAEENKYTIIRQLFINLLYEIY